MIRLFGKDVSFSVLRPQEGAPLTNETDLYETEWFGVSWLQLHDPKIQKNSKLFLVNHIKG
jgi:hypothetical protein